MIPVISVISGARRWRTGSGDEPVMNALYEVLHDHISLKSLKLITRVRSAITLIAEERTPFKRPST